MHFLLYINVKIFTCAYEYMSTSRDGTLGLHHHGIFLIQYMYVGLGIALAESNDGSVCNLLSSHIYA